MKTLLCISFFCITVSLLPQVSYCQYIIRGNASQESCNCYSLTPNAANQSGSVWLRNQINLNSPFDYSFDVYLGCSDVEGADGIVFILQQDSTSIGSNGQGLGFEGIAPSVGISLDTYQNLGNGDPAYDHISIQVNGISDHSTDLAGPIQASAVSDNIEDCAWHILRIQWDPVSHTLSSYFDGNFRLSTQTDIISTIFNNNPLVYWGFSGSTGGQFNAQKFCTPLTPAFNSNFSDDATCIGTPVVFKDSSTSFSKIPGYFWDFGDGTISTIANPPPHNYPNAGTYNVKHIIIAADGCPSDTALKTITIGDKPTALFNIYDTCQTFVPRMENSTSVMIGSVSQWNWQLDGTIALQNTRYPQLSNTLSPGNHSLQLIAISDIGCVSAPLVKNFNIKNIPAVTIISPGGCSNTPISFTGQQTDNLTTIDSWHWDFGDGGSSDDKNTSHIYFAKGMYPAQLTVSSTNGCIISSSKDIVINAANAFAGNDMVVVTNTPFQLHGSGGTIYTWSPPTGLSNPNISDPVGKLTDDMRYLLTVATDEGCTDTASINIQVFKGSAIYVPTGFTPNNDGLNDILKPTFIGIKSLSYFAIYNRWGQKVFYTNNMNKGWDGTSNGENLDTGSFAWILEATDLIGKVYTLKGVVTIVR